MLYSLHLIAYYIYYRISPDESCKQFQLRKEKSLIFFTVETVETVETTVVYEIYEIYERSVYLLSQVDTPWKSLEHWSEAP